MDDNRTGAGHDLSTEHLVTCTPCREAYLAASEAFMRSTEPGGDLHRKMEELHRAVDDLETGRTETAR